MRNIFLVFDRLLVENLHKCTLLINSHGSEMFSYLMFGKLIIFIHKYWFIMYRYHKNKELLETPLLKCTETFQTYGLFNQKISRSVLPKGRSFLQTQHSPLYLLLMLPFRTCTQSLYHDLSIIWYLLLPRNVFSHLPYLPEHPSACSSFLASGPANLFPSSLSILALFFLLPLFIAQLHVLFCLSILHHPSFSISTSQMLPIVFAQSVVVSKSMHHTTIHSTQSTSLSSSLVLFPRVRRKFFSSC